jgi:hypothetical protein
MTELDKYVSQVAYIDCAQGYAGTVWTILLWEYLLKLGVQQQHSTEHIDDSTQEQHNQDEEQLI